MVLCKKIKLDLFLTLHIKIKVYQRFKCKKQLHPTSARRKYSREKFPMTRNSETVAEKTDTFDNINTKNFE